MEYEARSRRKRVSFKVNDLRLCLLYFRKAKSLSGVNWLGVSGFMG